MYVSPSTVSQLILFVLLPVILFLAIKQYRAIGREEKRSDLRLQHQGQQQLVDTAIRGSTLDLARRKAGLEPLGFDVAPGIALALGTTAPAVAPVASVAAEPQDEPIPVGEVLSEDSILPTPEASVLVPERVLTVPLVAGVHGIICFFAGESVALRRIHVEDPVKFGLPSADYNAGQVVLAGHTDEQLLADAVSLFPGVFLQILTDPGTEEALRVSAS